MKKRKGRLIALSLVLLMVAGCAARTPPSRPSPEAGNKELARMGYTIQAGAFARVENASRLTDFLLQQGLEATYFVAGKGLYKVRFGNFPTRAAARERAESLRTAGVIGDYYIVSPDDYAAAKKGYDASGLREDLVKTARSFVGVPYLWGGTDGEQGFDCSGLTMTVYQLNGFNLPRTSLEQAERGSEVVRERLTKGDLVFFQTGREKISHVGIYIGDNLFIHAPGRGKKIRTDSLTARYFRECFVGARSYF